MQLARPQTKFLRHLPESLPLTLVDVREVDPQAGTEPLHWRLLTTHPVDNPEQAWRIVEWYKQRWLIEQFFRILKTQGFKLEDSQIATAERLLKLVAIAAKAAVITLQLVQARDGRGRQKIGLVFDADQIAALTAINRKYEAATKRLKNPHPPDQPRLGRLDHRPPRRLGRLSILQTAGSHHHEKRPRMLLRHRSRMEPQRCVHALAQRGEVDRSAGVAAAS